MVEKKVAALADFAVGTGKTVEVDGKQIALFRVEDKVYAINNTCPHAGGPLGEGSAQGSTVICPWHGWEFDVTTGAWVTDESVKVACYSVRLEGEDIFVSVE